MAAEGLDLGRALVLAPTPPGDWLVIAPTLISVVAGSILLMLRKRVALQPPIALASLALLVAATGLLLFKVMAEGPAVMTMGRWLPPFGITFAADVLGATLAFTASLAALAVGIFAVRDIPAGLRRYGFFPYLLLMMTGVLSAFLTGDVFNLYVWFEVLLIASFGMIVLGNSKRQLDGALRYALLNLVATTLFLVATGYLYGLTGTLNMADLAGRIRAMDEAAPLATIAGLYALAFAMKAAAFPLNFWLPASYHTPAAATSALFAGLLTKVGIYALLRVLVMLMPAERALYADLLSGVAIATMVVGALGAISVAHLRRMVGYFLIVGIGAMIGGIALGTAAGLAGTVAYAVHSMLAMTAFYLAAGVVERIGGSSDLRRLGGLYAAHPLLAALVLLLMLAAAGLPPASGLWPKVGLTIAALDQGRWWLAAAILVSALVVSLAGARAFAHIFWRAAPLLPQAPSPAGPGVSAEKERAVGPVLIGPLVALSLAVLALGIWPAPLFHLAERSAAGLLEPQPYIDAVFPP
jgi:multicomponent Na+:H+ antiporter subunit D